MLQSSPLAGRRFVIHASALQLASSGSSRQTGWEESCRYVVLLKCYSTIHISHSQLLSASAFQRTQLTNFSFNFLNNLVPNPSGQDKQDSRSPGRAALCGMSQPKQVEESVRTEGAIVGISSLHKESIRVWRWLTLGFLNQSRVLRVST